MYNQARDFFEDLPLILAGPILRHTEAKSVTVLLALKQACQVELKVYATTNDGQGLGNCLFEGRRFTVAVGNYLHVVAITAMSPEGDSLMSDCIYAYDLQFTCADQTLLTLEQALCSNRFPQVIISYFEHQKPTFVLPPDRLEDLHIIHASCRKPHGSGVDALPILDSLIASTANQPRRRPHQLFLTGDQIYGDDVSAPFLWVASHLGDALLGWEEKLPVGQRGRTPQELAPGERAQLATIEAGFTAGLQNKSAKVSSHLFSLGEYYAAYLLAWSPVCWPDAFPPGKWVTSDRQSLKTWDRAVADLRQLIYTLTKVRRALANIPVYTIFDDHDVSDDWNLNQAWCLQVFSKPLGRRTVQNALLAYSVFQAWGNTPEQFAVGQSGKKLLATAESWSLSGGKDMAADEAIANYLGIPSCDPHTGLPNFVLEDGVLILQRHPEALTWHYTITSNCHEVIVLDTRTWRGYPADKKSIAPPMLLSPRAMKQQLIQPLQKTTDNQNLNTFVITPTNVFELQVIDWIHHWQLKREKVFSTDVGDAWNVNFEALARLLTTLCEQRQQVVILSGDIHYSCATRFSYGAIPHSPKQSVLVQLTASALKNEETMTRLVHTSLKHWLLPEKTRRWLGWNDPPKMLQVSGKRLQRRQAITNPNWHSVLEWMPRQPTEKFPVQVDISTFIAARNRTNFRSSWLQLLKFWQFPWLKDGREVVGLNNLASVHFDFSDTNNCYQVIQDNYWFSFTFSTEIVYSRFATNLQPNQYLLDEFLIVGSGE